MAARQSAWALLSVVAAWVWTLAVWTTCCVGTSYPPSTFVWVVGMLPPAAAGAYSIYAAVRAYQARFVGWCMLTITAALSCVVLPLLTCFLLALADALT